MISLVTILQYNIDQKNMTISIEQVDQLYVGDDPKQLPAHQIRLVSAWFVDHLKTTMQTNYNPLTQRYILHVDLLDCPTRADFQMKKKFCYRYWVLGGNHSVVA